MTKFEFFQNKKKFSQFEFEFFTILVFAFCHNLSFWVWSKFEFCHNLGLVTICFIEFCHNLSFWSLSKFEFSSVATIWVFRICANLTYWVFSKLRDKKNKEKRKKIWQNLFCHFCHYCHYWSPIIWQSCCGGLHRAKSMGLYAAKSWLGSLRKFQK